MIDVNEISGWVSHCSNVRHLEMLVRHIQERIQQLGAAPPEGHERQKPLPGGGGQPPGGQPPA